jgi:hypothetical protein
MFSTWEPFTDDDANNPQKYHDKFKSRVQPTINSVFARYKFNIEVQGSESIDKFVTRLRINATDCKILCK